MQKSGAGEKSGGSYAFRSLDAWRGIAALAVLNYHLIGFLSFQSQAVWASKITRLISHGYIGVEIFFVISGYCIAAASASNRERGQGVGKFVWARVRRIYPAYWAALVLTIVAGLLWRTTMHGSGAAGAGTGPGGGGGTLAAGLLSATTVWPAAVYAGNVALAHVGLGQTSIVSVSWTLAYELAFYMVCAAALGALVRRGVGTVLGALHGVTIVSLLWLILVPQWRSYPLDMWPHFGLGVLVFDLLRPRPAAAAGKPFALWATAAGVAVLFAVNAVVHPHLPLKAMDHHEAAESGAVAVAFAAVLLATYRYDDRIVRLPGVALLSGLGLFSYSLYLTHYYVVGFWTQWLVERGTAGHALLAQYVGLTAASIALAYAFYRAVERPFMRMRSTARPKAAPAAVVGAEPAAETVPVP